MGKVKIAINLTGINALTGGVAGLLAFAGQADAAGIDQLTLSDHVVMGEAFGAYPYGNFPSAADTPWYEPITLLAAIAATTARARLSTSILIAPLRPAVFLAKQLATLDHLSGGRLEVGVGTGWQKVEYESCGVAFAKRRGLLEEQVRAMQALWTAAPASFAGEQIAFEKLYSLPFPLQKGGIPVWFGLAPGPKNLARMAELGAGWAPWFGIPEGSDADVSQGEALRRIAEGRTRIAAALAARGRDPEGFAIRAMPVPLFRKDGRGFDLAATLAQVGEYVGAGVTHLEFAPGIYCRDRDELAAALAAIAALRG